ncbi:MAG: hypothetical protein NT029_14125 [Armatimonadetes bacterium]|nr:hypothetical protein [Armatimonadota bacterium]
MSHLSTGAKLGYIARKVVLSPVSLAAWAAATAAWLAAGAPPEATFGVALAVDLVMLARRLRDEDYLRKTFAEREEKAYDLTDEQVEDVLDQMDFETRQRVRYILQLQKEILREARGSDVAEYAQKDLDQIASRLPALLQRAIRIGTRKQQLARYLAQVDERSLASYCSGLRQKIASTADDVSRTQYEQALKARETELQTYASIKKACGRIDSQLENVEATFASWKAKVIRIKTLDISSAASLSENLNLELDGLSHDIELLDSSVTEALSGDEPAPLRQSV